MKKLTIFLFVLFLFSVAYFAQQKDSAKIFAGPYPNIGSDPENIFRLIQPNEIMLKYVGKEPLRMLTGSGSGKKSIVIINPGFIFYADTSDYRQDNIRKIALDWCGNNSEVKPGGKYQSLGIPKNQTLFIATYEQLHSIRSSADQELIKKWNEYFLKFFGDDGELDNIQNNLTFISTDVESIKKDISDMKGDIKTILSQTANTDEEDGDEKKSLWPTVAKVTVVVAGIICGYFIIKNNIRSTTTTTITVKNTGGPVISPH